MIFVTVGSQMPFDRLINAVDLWARQSSRTDVFAQTGPSDIKPRHIQWVRELTPDAFHQHMIQAQAVVAHAGMGTILTALERSKPILVMPRRGDLRETRNDHQVATAQQFEKQGRLSVAYDTTELSAKLDALTHLKPSAQIEHQASSELLSRLRSFVDAIP
jgi:UDP-N-acetylglucosamine transferase subunit ALG13